MMMMSSEVSSAARNKKLEEEEEVEVEEEDEEEEELELGLSLGAKKINGSSSSNKYCRILTAKDFPAVMGSRASPMPSSSSSSVSSSATLGNGCGGGSRGNKTHNQNPPSQVVVGWPPIRAFRMNNLVIHSKENASDAETADHKKSEEDTRSKNHEKKRGHVGSSRFVKVNMDGDPIGRKVDLNAHVSYETLALALETMFHKPTTGLSTSAYSMKASKLLDGSSEFALTYEDKDGDWMLVGDVPWGMFLDTVKRLRIMRTSDASGLAPRFQPTTGVS